MPVPLADRPVDALVIDSNGYFRIVPNMDREGKLFIVRLQAHVRGRIQVGFSEPFRSSLTILSSSRPRGSTGT
jgi:hypothetical protein